MNERYLPTEAKTVEHDGYRVRIEIRLSDEMPSMPDYTFMQLQEWRNGEWWFVDVDYTATKAGVELATEHMLSHWDDKRSIEGWIAEQFYHPDMLSAVTTAARAKIAELTA